jgi:hypothetical protein
MFWLFLACVLGFYTVLYVCIFVFVKLAVRCETVVVQETQKKKEVIQVASWERTEGTDWDDVKMNF